MKLRYVGFGLMIIVAGCTCNRTADTEPDTTDTIMETTIEVDSLEAGPAVTNIPPLWKVELQPDHTEKLKQPEEGPAANVTAQSMVTALNATYPEIKLQIQKTSHDTLYVAIPESDYLSRQIGSTGAYSYLAAMVYNLTEVDGIKYVTLDFKEGDHAVPGTYSREDFKRLR